MQYDKYLFISMILKNTHKNKKVIYLLIIFIFIMHLNGSFYNLYVLSKFNITERLIKSYGNCDKAGYGFINNIYKSFNINENVLILNDNPNFSFNNSIWFKYNPNFKTNKKKIILINNKSSLDFIDKDKVNLIFKKEKYGTYRILKNISNCFYMEKYD
tara:strand:- start:2909 stop:3382 length:474 start_codon:yes stop_codon:yes gene_type:complete